MPRAFTLTASALAFATLSACGGSGTSSTGGVASSGFTTPPSLSEALTFANLAEADVVRIGSGTDGSTGIAGTVFSQVPKTGSATFTGPGAVSVVNRTVSGTTTTDTSVVDMLGTARVTVNFGNDRFNGTVRDMFAVDATGQVGLVNGVVSTTGDLPRPSTQTNLLDGTATGALTAFGTTYNVSGDVEGLMRGTNPGQAVPVRAINLDGEGSVAGTPLISQFSIVGDKYVGGGTGAYVNR